MKGKSVIVQILTTLVLLAGANVFGFTGEAAAWTGIVGMAISMLLSKFAPSGSWVKNVDWVFYGTNIIAILIQLAQATGEASLVPVNITNGIVIVLNIVLQVYFTNKLNENVKVS